MRGYVGHRGPLGTYLGVSGNLDRRHVHRVARGASLLPRLGFWGWSLLLALIGLVVELWWVVLLLAVAVTTVVYMARTWSRPAQTAAAADEPK
jgi:hypothetical protein